jgi:micrococcal nuclease
MVCFNINKMLAFLSEQTYRPRYTEGTPLIKRLFVMKKFFISICMITVLYLAFCGSAEAGKFKVTKVYDGDTIMAEGHDIVTYVLLAGIDAPEISSPSQEPGQPYAQAAKRYLERLILNKAVEIKGYGIAPYPYNQLIGEVYVGTENINISMLKKGLAEVSVGEPPMGLDIAPYLEAEKEAKKSGQGMWSLGDGYVSPSEWRKARMMK